ncbi:DUF305 domain-containing protein [Orbaceae bacterium ac157xtp]
MKDHNHSANMSPATEEFEKEMQNMHKPMMEGIMDSNPDKAFIKGMIPHHKGAMAMAETILKYSNNKEIRQLAEKIIKGQKEQVEWMNKWLADHQN